MSADDQHERGLRPAPLEGEVVGRARARGVARREQVEFDEGPTPADIERFSDVTRTCPECKKEVFDDAEVCYHCGHVFGRADQKGLPKWVVATVCVVLAGFVWMLIGGGSWRMW